MNTVENYGKAIIQRVIDTNDTFELHEDETTYHLEGNIPNQMLQYIYKESPDLDTAIEGFACMCGVFNHFGASESLCQDWFNYNIKRWADSHNICKEQFYSTIESLKV